MIALLFLSFLAFSFLNIPVAFALGLASLITAVAAGLPLVLLPQRIFVGSDSFVLMCIPLFMLAGEIMFHGKVAFRLFRFCESLVGHVTGGLAHLNILLSMVFAGITGAAAADASAIGAMTIPQMIERGYKREMAASVTATASTIGVIIPPSIPMVIIGSLTGISVTQLFLGGFIPGTLIGLSLMLVSYIWCRRSGFVPERKFRLKEVFSSFFEGITALIMPLIIVGGIIAGLFTPTEAAAVAVIYGLFVSMVVFRTLKLRDLPQMLKNSVSGAAVVMLVVATASLYGWIVTYLNIPTLLADALFSISSNYYFILGVFVVVYLVAGMFLDMASNIIILVPIFYPIAQRIGMNPLHFGLVTTVALAIGLTTPPVAVCTMLACNLAKIRVGQIIKPLIPYIAVMVAVLIIVALYPPLTTFIPSLAAGK